MCRWPSCNSCPCLFMQTFIEGVLAAEKKHRPNQPGMEFSRLFKTVWENFGKFQVFHTAGEVSQPEITLHFHCKHLTRA